MSRTVLVVGAKPRSLGGLIADVLKGLHQDLVSDPDQRWDIATAGIEDEDYYADLFGDQRGELTELLLKVNPDHIVCTAGINEPRQEGQSLIEWYEEHFQANVIGPMRLLDVWLSVLGEDHPAGMPRHYVAISSNSAHIARTYSGAYCASKAALSMALRCKAREMKGAPVVVYGYEPGLLLGTPMTDEVNERLRGAVPSRIPGQPYGLDTTSVAAMVARNLAHSGRELNGCLLRVDGGDQ